MASTDDWFWAYGQNWTNYLASGAFDGIGFTAVYASDSPVFPSVPDSRAGFTVF
jgi:hypothetical protein